MSSKIRKAVSLIFQYKSRIYIIKRQNFLYHFPGYTVFPGGKVDPKESLEEAAEREAQEELGISIKDHLKEKNIISAQKIAHATTPDFNPYQFDTTFFYYICNKRPKFQVDANEVEIGEWIDPYIIIRRYNSGECLLINPIKVLLERLSERKGIKEFIEFDQISSTEIPSIEPLKDLLQLMPLSNTLPPADRTNCFIIGDSFKILVDPSPKDTEEYRKLLNQIKAFSIDKICLTHHHGDHHQFAPQVARHLGVPIYISKDSHERIISEHSEEYFKDIQIVEVKEGNTIGRWMGQPINVYEIPGHDEGHIGLAPERLNWFIVGDLFQGVGTVVVGGAEGNMSKYFSSLEKVINLNPNCVIPSHGIALGGTSILKKTLLHRQEREKQILELYKKNPEVDRIVKTLYFDIPRSLIPYAKANVLSHLNKLESEGKLD